MNENVPVVSPASSLVAPPLPQQGFIRLSPINRRRFNTFKANRRGYWSFWIFMVLFVVTLFAELLANDRPIVAQYKGELLFPIAVDDADRYRQPSDRAWQHGRDDGPQSGGQAGL